MKINVKKINWLNILIWSCVVLFITGITWLLVGGKSLIPLIILGIALIELIFLFLFKFEEVKKKITEFDWGEFASRGSYILLVIGIIVLVNIIASKRNKRFDLTAEKIYTLSDHTIKLLHDLEEKDIKVRMLFFRTPGSPQLEIVENLLNEYKARCSKIELEVIDPDKEPALAKQYNIRQIFTPMQDVRLYATIVFMSGDRKEQLDVLRVRYRPFGRRMGYGIDLIDNLEREISSAILRITKSRKKVYFVYGHGEVDISDESEFGWSSTKREIAEENYKIDKFYIAGKKAKVPSDCSLLIIAAPKKPYLGPELDFLNDYLEKGGHLLLMVDPFSYVDFNPLLRKWGVEILKMCVVDPVRSYLFQPLIPLVTEYGYHKITKDLKFAAFFPTVAPIKVLKKKPAGVIVSKIASTSKDSWGETSYKNVKQVAFNKGIDLEGPCTIMVAIEKGETRIVVIGDADFASNAYIRSYGNRDLLLNAINWLAGKEEMIGIRSKEPKFKEVRLTPVNVNLIKYTTVFLLPLLVIIGGVVVWLKRR